MHRELRRSWRLCLLIVHLLAGVVLSAIPAQRHEPARLWPLCWWSRRLGWILGLRLSIHGVAVERPALLVANHISWLDIICLASACPTYFLAKGEVARWPLFGWLCQRSGTLFIARGEGANHACEHIDRRLRAGYRVLLFPEGTSSEGHSVRRFHARLLQTAQSARVPIQPIMVAYPVADSHGTQQPNAIVPFVGEDNLLSHLWRLLGEAHIDAQVRFRPVFDSQQQDRSALARASQVSISTELEQLYAKPGPTQLQPQRVLFDEIRISMAHRASD